MQKHLLLITIFVFAILFPAIVFAEEQSSQLSVSPLPTNNTPVTDEPPEESGDYIVAGKPHVRVRVFAHPKEKRKERKLRVPTIVCALDNDMGTIVNQAGWHLKPGITSYKVNYSTVPSSVGQEQAKTAVANSFATWDALVSAVTLSEDTPASATRARLDGQNAVLWKRQSLSTLAVTYVWYNTQTKEALENDLVFNARHRWSYTPYTPSCSSLNSYDVQNIGTHEVGHWMGLDDMYGSSGVDLTMYGYGSIGELKKDTLTTGDKNGLNALYP